MIIATAGHVDHGKTSLVKALTGTDTDRLPEEKKRGLTIDLGFAYLDTGADQNLAFIDVPGHEKFVRTAIAGVGLADVAILVIAADDGPMPQTLEHLAILSLLGIRSIVPVVTKVDLVDEDGLAETVSQIDELLHDASGKTETFLVSTTDPQSIDKLKQYILKLKAAPQVRRQLSNFRMAIDRCFTLEGSGTIVTGTVAAGVLGTDDLVTLVSNNVQSGKRSRIRSLHTQNTKAERAHAGQRCALNLTGELSKSALVRGSWLVADKDFESTHQFDVVLQLPPKHHTQVFESDKLKTESRSKSQSGSLKHWTPAHLHIGTADIPCRIALLEVSKLEQGGRCFARLICERAAAVVNGDRFILRDQSARHTIAGGVVLDPHPPRRGRSKPHRLKLLQALDATTPQLALANLLTLSDAGVDLAEFGRSFDLPSSELNLVCERLELVVLATGNDHRAFTARQHKNLKADITNQLHQFHQVNPDQLGVDVMELNSLLGALLATPVLEVFLGQLQNDSLVNKTGSIYSLADHKVVLSKSDQKHWEIIHSKLQEAALVPPRVVELADVLDKEVDETVLILNRCMAHGKLYKVADNRYFLPQTLNQLASIAMQLGEDDDLTVARFRTQSGVGRNLVVDARVF